MIQSGSPANLLGIDYAARAAQMPAPCPIIDVHTHVAGASASAIYLRVARLFGIHATCSMTPLDDVERVRDVLGDSVHFIAVPDWRDPDRLRQHGVGFIERIERFHALGSRIAKFWAAPRALDYGLEVGNPDLLRLDAPARLEAMEAAEALGMILMTHVADPDTWFASRYADAARYGTKRQQYEPLEAALERFRGPWIAAHMGGWPENLPFLDGLLARHPNLHLDTSATKWMVRELGRLERADLVAFLQRWSGRILFGSDILTADAHITADSTSDSEAKAGSLDEAFDLYASRYWALRTLLETDHDGPSSIEDPDLPPVQIPLLRGKRLPGDVLASVYHDAAHALLATVGVTGLVA